MACGDTLASWVAYSGERFRPCACDLSVGCAVCSGSSRVDQIFVTDIVLEGTEGVDERCASGGVAAACVVGADMEKSEEGLRIRRLRGE